MKPEPPNALGVTADAKVGEMPLEHLAEFFMLIPDRPVPHCPALPIDRLLGASQAILRCQLPRYRPALLRFHPDMREPEEIELVASLLPSSSLLDRGL